MDKSTLLRWSIIAIGIIVFWQWGLPALTGTSSHATQPIAGETYVNAPDFVGDVIDPPAAGSSEPNNPPPGEECTLKGNRFEATLSSRGAGITHYLLTEPQYARSEAHDLSTTPDIERWRSLRTLFRGEGGSDQVKYDRFNWKLEKLGEAPDGAHPTAACSFSYTDDTVKIVKTVAAGARPYELEVLTTLTNLSDAPKKHRFAIQQFAFRKNKEVKGSLGRVSPFLTDLECANAKDVTRKARDDFKDGWLKQPVDRYAAISSTYFAQALVPEVPATCEILAEDWYSLGQNRDDDEAGAVYHARLDYGAKELAPGSSATYRVTAFGGPKERTVLGQAAGGGQKGLGDLINLGFFSAVAKVLVDVLLFFRNKVTGGNWGLAIIVMTFCLRMILFPLTWKSIKSSLAMRRLKPEVDALNEKFAGDPQAKNMAMMELWKKNGVNPFGGCLPQLVQMPIWFAMYTTLQTAVEMYHTKFLWFMDLSAPDKFFVLPIVLGVFMIVQQRIVPQQGMDPVQQKMMMYLLPGVFTVMMLFLPAALGVYMLTNSVLGIAQQLAIEQIAPKSTPKGKNDIEVRDAGTKPASASGGSGRNLGKGKARV